MKWEFKVYSVHVAKVWSAGLPENIGEVLDENGEQGWELVKVEPILRKGLLGGSYTDKFVLFFKRPRE